MSINLIEHLFIIFANLLFLKKDYVLKTEISMNVF